MTGTAGCDTGMDRSIIPLFRKAPGKFHHRFDIKWFCEDGICAAAGSNLLKIGVGGYKYNRAAVGLMLLFKVVADFATIRAGHGNIEEHHIRQLLETA